MVSKDASTPRALIMADDPLYRAAIRAILARAGFHATGGESFLHAWRLFRKGGFDLIVCDLGGEDCPRIRFLGSPAAKDNQAGVVLLAEGFEDGPAIVSLRNDWPEVLAKPVSHAELLEACSRALLRPGRLHRSDRKTGERGPEYRDGGNATRPAQGRSDG